MTVDRVQPGDPLSAANQNELIDGLNRLLTDGGGRVLRALLWRLRGDRDRATATAALVGIGFGLCFAAGGLVAVAATRTWQFAWYVVVAGFLVRTSWVQYRALRRAPGTVSVRPSRPSVSESVSVGVRTADRWSV